MTGDQGSVGQKVSILYELCTYDLCIYTHVDWIVIFILLKGG